jgi:hypothetical protein
MAIPFFVVEVFDYYSRCKELIVDLNVVRGETDQLSFAYYLFASQKAIRITTLLIITGFFTIMLLLLFLFQIKVVSLGFTTQFPPPPSYERLNIYLKSWSSAIKHRLRNLYIFFSKSPEQNMNLYNVYKAEHSRQMALNKPKIPYSVDDKENNKKDSELMGIGMGGMKKIFGPIIPTPNNNYNSNNNTKQFEIDLD